MMERLTIPDVRVDEHTIRRTFVDAGAGVFPCPSVRYGRKTSSTLAIPASMIAIWASVQSRRLRQPVRSAWSRSSLSFCCLNTNKTPSMLAGSMKPRRPVGVSMEKVTPVGRPFLSYSTMI